VVGSFTRLVFCLFQSCHIFIVLVPTEHLLERSGLRDLTAMIKRRYVFTFAGLLVIAIVMSWYLSRATGFMACLLVAFDENFEEEAPGLFVQKNMPDHLRDSLEIAGQNARERVGAFFGAQLAHPVIIAVHQRKLMARYGNVLAQTGLTHLSPLRAYIVLEPKGINTDVMSHELCHAELLHRLGWWKRVWEIPTWFDEGLAMMLDYRFASPDDEWVMLTQEGVYAPPLDRIETGKSFFKDPSKVYINYLTARHEVAIWHRHVQQEGLLRLINCIKEGGSFSECYQKQE
jgi:hypothetical protein